MYTSLNMKLLYGMNVPQPVIHGSLLVRDLIYGGHEFVVGDKGQMGRLRTKFSGITFILDGAEIYVRNIFYLLFCMNMKLCLSH
jgi:hypothetical protein